VSRILLAIVLCAVAATLHGAFCEWRRIEFDAADATTEEALVLVTWQRVEHPTGNAAAWDARRDVLRAYHRDWVACWDDEPGLDACSGAAPPGENATVKAVKRIACAEAHDLDVAGRASFRACLSARGHPDARRPHWTRDDFGIRFDGPYVTLTAMFAEDFRLGPGMGRALGWLRGVALPAVLVMTAWIVVRRRPE
jgi:hypothetical protein